MSRIEVGYEQARGATPSFNSTPTSSAGGVLLSSGQSMVEGMACHVALVAAHRLWLCALTCNEKSAGECGRASQASHWTQLAAAEMH